MCEYGVVKLWNHAEREEPKYNDYEKNLCQCHFIHHKSQAYYAGLEPKPSP